MSLQEIVSILCKKIGFSSDSIGIRSLESAVSRRIAIMNMDGAASYISLLNRSASEFQALIDSVTVPETWFFRDVKPFAYLEDCARKRRGTFKGPLRVLSVPCSTGEEAYSISISLLLAGLTTNDFTIEAIDVNQSALGCARRGWYPVSAFRDVDRKTMETFFSSEDKGFQVKSWLNTPIDFILGNALSLSSVVQHPRYDVVFCRNMLIYLDDEAKRTVLGQIRNLLSDSGLLFVGHAEAGTAVKASFAAEGALGAFAFHKQMHDDDDARVLCGTKVPSSQARTVQKKSNQARSDKNTRPTVKFRSVAEKSSVMIVDEIERLADSGQLVKADAKCAVALSSEANDGSLLYVCGVVKEAQGDQEAASELFARAAACAPENYQLLSHLAASLEAQGRDEEAEVLRKSADALARQEG